MTQDARRPLHRLTPLRDDPAAAWLSPGQRFQVLISKWISWVVFAILLRMLFWAQMLVMANLFRFVDWRLPAVLTGMAFVALVWPARRIILRRRSAKIAALVREATPKMAVAIDDFSDLERQPDGTLVSIVGWIRARVRLAEPVEGELCIGLALACHQRFPGVLETLNDFELFDETGRTVLVQVAGARMLGESNVRLTDAKARRLLIASLDLPVGAVATGWDAFVLREGDPVMALGFKQTALDPTRASLRAPAARATIASHPSTPLLLFPIAAERMPPTNMFNFS